jgi:hypothetical protein
VNFVRQVQLFLAVLKTKFANAQSLLHGNKSRQRKASTLITAFAMVTDTAKQVRYPYI